MKALSPIATGPISIDTLREEISHICGAFVIEPAKARSASHGLARKQMIGTFDAALISLDAKFAMRTTTCIRRDPGEYFFMLVQDHGECVVHQSGTTTLLRPGDMFIVDATQPSEFIYDGQLAHQISVHLPRDEILARFGGVCDGGVAIDRNDPLWLAMRAVLVKMMRCSPKSGLQLSEAFYGLMGAYFYERSAQDPDPRVRMLDRALKVIAREFRDPAFGPGILAEALGVSLRTLQRNFEILGETPGERLLQTRLSQARTELAAVSSGTSVADCAYACGFNDLSYFYHVFGRQYGETPGSVMRGRGVFLQ